MPRAQVGAGRVQPCRIITLTGNLIGSGAPNRGALSDPHQSAYVRFEVVCGITFTGNAMNAGRDAWSPDYEMAFCDRA